MQAINLRGRIGSRFRVLWFVFRWDAWNASVAETGVGEFEGCG